MARTPRARSKSPRTARRAVPPPPEPTGPSPEELERQHRLEDHRRRAAPIFDLMYEGKPARAACRIAREADPTSPDRRTLDDWAEADPELARQYARARDGLLDTLADEILTIGDEEMPPGPKGGVDNGAVQQARLRVDSRKFLLSKLRPGTYGDRVDVTSGGQPIPVGVLVAPERAAGAPKGP